MSISDIQIGDKVFHNNAEGILDLVFIRDFTEEEERFVLIQNPAERKTGFMNRNCFLGPVRNRL